MPQLNQKAHCSSAPARLQLLAHDPDRTHLVLLDLVQVLPNGGVQGCLGVRQALHFGQQLGKFLHLLGVAGGAGARERRLHHAARVRHFAVAAIAHQLVHGDFAPMHGGVGFAQLSGGFAELLALAIGQAGDDPGRARADGGEIELGLAGHEALEEQDLRQVVGAHVAHGLVDRDV